MPFVAIEKATNHRIDITRIEDPRSVLRPGEYVCQLCGEPMIVKAGYVVRAHFAHRAVCKSDYAWHPESVEHLEFKYLLRDHLQKEFNQYATADIDIEVKVPEAKRVADVMMTFPMGWRIAHEVQLAGITTIELEERTEAYLNAGIDVIWWLGKNANTQTNRMWCLENIGLALVITDNYISVAEAKAPV